MNILLTDGNNRAALAITRSLGRAGYTVFCGEKTEDSISSASKYCHGKFTYADPVRHSDKFVEDVLQQVEIQKIDLVIPVSEITTLLITENSEMFQGKCKLAFSDYFNIANASNKAHVFDLAAKLDVPIPRTHTLNSILDLETLDPAFPYPVVIKPSRSRVKTKSGWLLTRVSYAYDSEELRKSLEDKPEEEYPVLLQQRINGPGIGVFACYADGQLMAIFSHRRLREKPPSGGVSVLRESTEVNPKAKLYTDKLLKALKWNGVAMVEFKLDEDDNEPKLMEINARYWGSLQLAIDAGVNFPLIMTDYQLKQIRNPVPQYRVGIRSRWFWGDFDALLLLLLKPPHKLQLPPSHPGRLKTLLEFLKLWNKQTHYEVFSWKDIKPWLLETRRKFF
ncbi:MAG: ATP-grasp domain-containing protein [Gammaproteobacteria bacterium]|nr:ATP-grasp domain-containing protein [Gammaproteobacteria bacterium]MDH5799226.1 ATP-grasp domain-containing protein [Gammaproteobacteria bacterium]